MIMVDTNIIIDVREATGSCSDWSLGALADARSTNRVAVSAIVIGELASRGAALAEITTFVEDLGLAVEPLGSEAAHLAGMAQRRYRDSGGGREHLLGDFLIGAHAEAAGAALITRDTRRYRHYFPDLTLITPETDHD